VAISSFKRETLRFTQGDREGERDPLQIQGRVTKDGGVELEEGQFTSSK